MVWFIDVAAALNRARVAYAVAGGLAVVLHGHTRMTVDLDVVLDLDHDNVMAALDTLGAMGLTPRLPVPAEDFADEAIRESWVRDRHLVAFTLHDPHDARREVDLFAHPPIAFAVLDAESVIIEVGEVPVRVVSLRHLIAMKRLAGRPQDLADIDALLRLHPGLHSIRDHRRLE